MLSSAAAEDPGFCPDILTLTEEAQTQFVAIRGEPATGALGDYQATLVLPDAASCVILEDAEKSSYHCHWTYPLGAKQAHDAFEGLLDEVRHCLGESASEHKDRSVNHPDTYASYSFESPSSVTSINLKNKSALKSTLVSIRIDGLPQEN